MTETPECIKGPEGCAGEVEWRNHHWNLRNIVNRPYCSTHWTERVEQQERIDRLYAPNSDCPPRGFDPADAGERWDDDY